MLDKSKQNENPIIKCWGKVWNKYNNDKLNLHLLEVNKGWRSSIHYHADKWNCFINISSIIQVDNYGLSNISPINIVASQIIKPGDSLTIPPKIWHCFKVLESGSLTELYWTNDDKLCTVDDIFRYDEGGRFTDQNESHQEAVTFHNNK